MNLAHTARSSRRARESTRMLPWLVFLLLAAVPVSATTVVQFGTAQLADLSDTAVRGTVLGTESRMHSEHQFIYTYVSIQVNEVLKGNPGLTGTVITLQELGGRIDRLTHSVPGVPSFTADEEVLTFLENREDGYFRTYGMAQGKFRLETDARTGARLLTRPGDMNDAALAVVSNAVDLTPARPDGNYDAEPFLQALRERRNQR